MIIEGVRKMKDGTRTEYLHEHFSTAYLLQGEITDLEEIKQFIIARYERNGLPKLITSTYSTRTVSIRNKQRVQERTLLKNRGDTFTLGFMLRGVEHCEEITACIQSCMEKGAVHWRPYLISGRSSPSWRPEQVI
jgi:hypothetical protein